MDMNRTRKNILCLLLRQEEGGKKKKKERKKGRKMEVGGCTWRYVLKIILITTGLFLFFAFINILTLAGFSKFYYNTTYECIYENITYCYYNPENRLITQWALSLSFIVVLVGLALFILYLTIQYIRKTRSTTYTIPEFQGSAEKEELEFTMNGSSDDDESSISHDYKEKTK